MFKKNPTTVLEKTSWYFKGKQRLILTEIGEEWYKEKMNTKLPHFKTSFEKKVPKIACWHKDQVRQSKQTLSCLEIPGDLEKLEYFFQRKYNSKKNPFFSP